MKKRDVIYVGTCKPRVRHDANGINILSVACPKCFEGAGRTCISRFGGPTFTHSARYDLARKSDREKYAKK